MWVIRAILIAIIVIAIIGFVILNPITSQQVDVDLYFAKYVGVSLVIIVFWSLVVGMLASLILFISVYIKLSVQLRIANKRSSALESEVSVLRNRPIEESVKLIKDISKDEELKSPFESGESI